MLTPTKVLFFALAVYVIAVSFSSAADAAPVANVPKGGLQKLLFDLLKLDLPAVAKDLIQSLIAILKTL